MTARAAIVIIGIGNPMRTDDGVGPAAIERLERDPPDGDLLLLDAEPTRLIEAWRDRALAVVVDAVRTGAAPGTIHERTLDQLDDVDAAPTAASSHGTGVAEAIVYSEDNALVGKAVCADVRLVEGEPRGAVVKRIKTHCFSKLESYKVPVKIRIVDEIAHSERGKTLRPQSE